MLIGVLLANAAASSAERRRAKEARTRACMRPVREVDWDLHPASKLERMSGVMSTGLTRVLWGIA